MHPARYLRAMRAAFSSARNSLRTLRRLDGTIDDLRMSIGSLHAEVHRENHSPSLADHEFQVYSQWGEDGIIQYLTAKIDVPHKTFVEFGVEDYEEANTKFLLKYRNWSGLVIDGDPKNVQHIKDNRHYWRYDLRVDAAFLTAENVDEVIKRNGISGDIGLLSIDVDGNDYWLWKSVDAVSPRIVVCEYNSHFGARRKVTVPYDPNFDKRRAHFSELYYGASLAALTDLARDKGYKLVGSNSAGLNAFFVRNDVGNDVPEVGISRAYCRAQFRETRSPHGDLDYQSFEKRVRGIQALRVYDIEQKRFVLVSDLGDY
jgi:hypothetical protein